MMTTNFVQPASISAESIIFRHHCSQLHCKTKLKDENEFKNDCLKFEQPKFDITNPLYDIWKQSQQVFSAVDIDKRFLLKINFAQSTDYIIENDAKRQFEQIPNTKEAYFKIWCRLYYDAWLSSSLEGMMSKLFSTVDYEKHYLQMKNSEFFEKFDFSEKSINGQLATREFLQRKFINTQIREFATMNFSWSVPSNNGIQAIIDFTKGKSIVDLCCGRGYWSYVLKKVGKTVLSVDKNVGDSMLVYSDVENTTKNSKIKKSKAAGRSDFVKIVQMEASEYLKKNSGCLNDALFMSWIDDTETVENCLSQYKGDTVIIICEDDNGCTGTIKDTVKWTFKSEIVIPRFHGIYDLIKFYKKNTCETTIASKENQNVAETTIASKENQNNNNI